MTTMCIQQVPYLLSGTLKDHDNDQLSKKYSSRQNRPIIVISYNVGALDMLMLSNRHLDPCDCFSLVSAKKFGEMKILWSF